MAHWIDATEDHKERPIKINADSIAYLMQIEGGGLTSIHFIGSNHASGKPDLLVLETPEELMARIERPR
jgi:hypothetical protein